jgi:hypothetical protein
MIVVVVDDDALPVAAVLVVVVHAVATVDIADVVVVIDQLHKIASHSVLSGVGDAGRYDHLTNWLALPSFEMHGGGCYHSCAFR